MDPSGEACSPGITDTEINLGGSLPLSGPAAIYGSLAHAAEAVFEKANADGGVESADGKTRTINYTYLDDGYEPARTARNVRTLVERDNIFSTYGVFGTSNALAAREYLQSVNIPLLQVDTGSDQFQEINSPDLFGAIMQYGFQAGVAAQYILKEKPDAKIGILYQNNGYGEDMLRNYTAAFEGTGAEIVSAQAYDLSAGNVDSQIIALKDSGADVFLNYGAGTFVPAAIKKAYEIGWTPLQVVSTEGGQIETGLKPAGVEAATGVLSVAVLKDVADPQWGDDNPKVVYSDLAEYAPDEDWENDALLYRGVLQAEIMLDALRGMEGCTVEDLETSIHNLDLESAVLRPGLAISTSEDYAFAPTEAQIVQFDGESWVTADDTIFNAREVVVGE
ncbi:ABC transporter substrate-binding protein [Microbacterium aoyamense]|uniref:ABC transporter substrate-binding protein n=1 Tax=Microbacterium aoyamense TaxID=344166 RepID=A0ABP5ALW0_9MICO